MLSTSNPSPSPFPSDAKAERELRLYRHAMKQEWGYGILAWEGPLRRRYQFEDGKMRTIGRGYYDKMVEVETPPANARALIAELSAGRDVALARRRLEKIDPGLVKDVISFEAQVELFLKEYPKGFQGERWRVRMRGVGAKRPLKRHRDPVIAKAGALLDRAVLDSVLAEGRAFTHVEALIELLGRTDLVRQKGEVSRLVTMDAAQRTVVIEALRVVLAGSVPLASSFSGLIAALTPAGESHPSWPLVTVLPALAMPKAHTPVRGALFRRQSHWVAPELEHRNVPSGALYVAYLDMAQTIERSLLRRGLMPRDLVDVYDFMSLTLRIGTPKKEEPQLAVVQNGVEATQSPVAGTA